MRQNAFHSKKISLKDTLPPPMKMQYQRVYKEENDYGYDDDIKSSFSVMSRTT